MAFVDCALSYPVRAELVEALACWLGKHAWVECGSRESPGVRVTFFCFAKRTPLRRRAHTPAPALNQSTLIAIDYVANKVIPTRAKAQKSLEKEARP